jgi:murein DD-endopeptidase MepM/ murein hydrolase activator NlpD
METQQQTPGLTGKSGKKVNKDPFWSAQALALAVFYLLYAQTVHAGILDFFSKKVQAENRGVDITSSRLPVMSALAYDANLTKTAYDDVVNVSDDEALTTLVGPQGTVLDIDGEYIPETDTISIYVVKKGDTIASIARDSGVSTNTIMWANSLKKGQDLKVGSSLTILPITGVKYTVKKGDTLQSIAKKLSADAGDIADYNDIDSTDLKAGMAIIVPDGEITTVAEKPKAKKEVAKTKTDTNTGLINKITSAITGSNDNDSDNGSGNSGKVVLSNKGEKTWGYNAPVITGYYAHPLPGGRKTQHVHGFNGTDWGAPKGTPILASASGRVIIAKGSGYNGGYGQYVVIEHDNGTQTLYAHASKVLVSVGDNVKQGETIALVGSTGRSTGNHLHFEVRGAWNPF